MLLGECLFFLILLGMIEIKYRDNAKCLSLSANPMGIEIANIAGCLQRQGLEQMLQCRKLAV